MIKVQITGQQDLEGTWNSAICGFGGSGKSLFASTAPDPLFVFFRENPTLKSIASRAVPHVILVNDIDGEGHLVASMLDKLKAMVAYLSVQEHDYQTLVIDTGDEMFQAMKEGRRALNHGEFGPGDWGWLGDAYREVMETLLALDMDVIVLFHLKNSQLDDGITYRELMLQGVATDEAPTWFDVVAALDTFETTNEDGQSVTRRVLLTHSSRLYPWVIDRSGNLPARFELSETLLSDYKRYRDVLTQSPEIEHEGGVAEEIPPLEGDDEEKGEDVPVPSPEELEEKKQTPPEDSGADTEEEPQDVQPPEESTEDVSAPEPDPPEEEAPTLSPEPEDDTPHAHVVEEQEEQPLTPEETIAELDGTSVMVCVECGAEVDDSMQEISQIRFRKYLCRTHYKEAMNKGAS